MGFLLSVVTGLVYVALNVQTSGGQVKPELTGIVHTTDVDIAYNQFGHDTGRTPAIIVNGGPGFSHTYMLLTDIFTRKVARDRSVSFYDQRGIGNSKLLHAAAPQGIESQVADLEALRVKLGYGKMDLIGHSWGGELVMAYGAAYPQHIQHLVLIDSAAPQFSQTLYLFNQVYPDQLAEDQKTENGNDAAAKSNGEMLRQFVARDFYSQKRVKELTRKLSNEEIGNISNNDVFRAVDDAIKRVDLTDILEKFTFPTLVMWGRCDINVAVLTGWNISQAIPNSRMVIYEKSGHFPFHEEGAGFLDDLSHFLSDVPVSAHGPQERVEHAVAVHVNAGG
jgi:proline iminopeptidase